VPSVTATTRPKSALYAEVRGPDGKTRNVGRIDRKWWAPRAWWYRFVQFPILARRKQQRIRNNLR